MTTVIDISQLIVDEQTDFYVLNKPAGIGFHNEDGEYGFFQQAKLALSAAELFPVHRLDKMTSGLIIVAKNKSTAATFQTLFEQRQIEKYYLAISDKKPIKKQGLIKGDMAKSRRGMWKLLRSQQNPAKTQFFSYPLENSKRLFIVKPHTGKTHQIRVALNSLGAPILGDPLYGEPANIDRGYLHAFALRFELNNQAFSYVLPASTGGEFTSEICQKNLEPLSPPWQLPWPKI